MDLVGTIIIKKKKKKDEQIKNALPCNVPFLRARKYDIYIHIDVQIITQNYNV